MHKFTKFVFLNFKKSLGGSLKNPEKYFGRVKKIRKLFFDKIFSRIPPQNRIIFNPSKTG